MNQNHKLNPSSSNPVNTHIGSASFFGFPDVFGSCGKSLIFWALGVLLLPFALMGAETRGIWWYSARGDSWGAEQVLGDSVREAEVIHFLQEWNIGQVYCGFNARLRGKVPLLRAWNTKLHAAGRSSQLLLDENTWIYPQHRAKLLALHIQHDLIDFNATAANPRQRYDALHLDIEPQGLPEWKTLSPAGRKELLFMLRDTFQQVRLYLNQHGAADISVYADLPVWYDQVPEPVGWSSIAERDDWFADLGKSLAGISLMAYEQKTPGSMENKVGWEVQNFKGEVRIGLKASIGAGKTWNSLGDFVAMIQTQEAAKPLRKVDIFDLIQFHAATGMVSAVK